MANQADGDRIVQLVSQRGAAQLADANVQAGLLQEALERSQAELAEAKERISKLEAAEDLVHADVEAVKAVAGAHENGKAPKAPVKITNS